MLHNLDECTFKTPRYYGNRKVESGHPCPYKVSHQITLISFEGLRPEEQSCFITSLLLAYYYHFNLASFLFSKELDRLMNDSQVIFCSSDAGRHSAGMLWF